MNFLTAFKYSVLLAVILACGITTASAVNVSDKQLKEVEKQVFEQSMEHKKLQAQATQISLELSEVSRKMVKTARQLQNNEEKLSGMEKQLELLRQDLESEQQLFLKEDTNLIKTLTALQNLALKPAESLLVQPLNPVDIIRSAMILRGTVPQLKTNANHIRNNLLSIFFVIVYSTAHFFKNCS